jgi:hypothetical protein
MTQMKYRQPISKKGSALLIVLGFLSFIIVSGVSFAVYMRLERQATSSYRHAVTARHMLNTALLRAMDEVDSELRLKVTPSGIVSKFPSWPGRVLTSAIWDADDDKQEMADVRVLALESLAFLPPFLVNDVRHYAVRQSTMTGTSGIYKGAKWRTLEGDVPGRYAYACVNVSDLLDVNASRADPAAGRDSGANRLSLGSLFTTAAERTDFDTLAQSAGQFLSLQDFYAARYKADSSALSSPYLNYRLADDVGSGLNLNFSLLDLLNQPFIAGGFAKAEPPRDGACNIALNPPFDDALMMNEKPSLLALDSAFTDAKSKPFWDAMDTIETLPNLTSTLDKRRAYAMLKDYLDTDYLPSCLASPATEMVPMVNQIVIDKRDLNAQIYTTTATGSGSGTIEDWKIGLFSQAGPRISSISVELVYPYRTFAAKNMTRPSSFKVRGIVRWTLMAESAVNTGITFPASYSRANLDYEVQTTEVSVTLPAENSALDAYYDNVLLEFSIPPEADVSDIVGTRDPTKPPAEQWAGPFKNQTICVVCTVMIQVLDESGEVLDQVPCVMHEANLPVSSLETNWRTMASKLYFKTQPVTLTGAISAMELECVWNSLEIPDPRFNYKAANWVIRDLGAMPPYVELDMPRQNPSATALLGNNGRDADIFMSVSDAGYMQSPGELGFIIRPFQNSNAFGGIVDLGTRTLANMLTIATDSVIDTDSDIDHMFRTIRLYDHGGTGPDQKQDDVYRWLYYAPGGADSALPGPRVNPLSDLGQQSSGTTTYAAPQEAAIWDTPADYWFAATNNPLRLGNAGDQQTLKEASLTRRVFFPGNKSNPSTAAQAWQDFSKAWRLKMANVANVTNDVNRYWGKSISEYYGDQTYFDWYTDYTDTARMKIFGQTLSLQQPLCEVDRKMLYSFSLDSMSDRQQLFLYFIRAEATQADFGGGQVSLAGGRAVALVWRDPYLRGYVRPNPSVSNNDISNSAITGWEGYATEDSTLYNGETSKVNEKYKTPWARYSGHDSNGTDARYPGLHDTRVLFFKQMGQ